MNNYPTAMGRYRCRPFDRGRPVVGDEAGTDRGDQPRQVRFNRHRRSSERLAALRAKESVAPPRPSALSRHERLEEIVGTAMSATRLDQAHRFRDHQLGHHRHLAPHTSPPPIPRPGDPACQRGEGRHDASSQPASCSGRHSRSPGSAYRRARDVTTLNAVSSARDGKLHWSSKSLPDADDRTVGRGGESGGPAHVVICNHPSLLERARNAAASRAPSPDDRTGVVVDARALGR